MKKIKRATPVKLKGNQRFQLYDWIKLNINVQDVEKYTCTQIGNAATAVLKFPIADSTIAEIIDHLGLKKGTVDLLERIKDLEARVAKIEANTV